MAETLAQEARHEIYLEEKARLEARKCLVSEEWHRFNTLPLWERAENNLKTILKYGFIVIVSLIGFFAVVAQLAG